jgi:hypothetical protein
MLRLTGLLLATLLFASTATGQARPTSYADFDASIAPSDGAALKSEIESGVNNYIYLRRGYYVVNNPVVIDRTTSLYLHGADRMYTVLVAANPSQPMFIVKNAPLLNFAGLHFFPNRNSVSSLNARAILTENTQPVVFEMLDCVIDQSALEIGGPGQYQLQAPIFNPGGRADSSLMINHPGADVFVFGGDGDNGKEALRVADFAFVWQKQGRLRIYATTFEAGLGPADIRIESGSSIGPHVIANVRSEGVNGALYRSGAVSRLLYVPSTSDKVDVVLKSNGGAWDTGPMTDRLTRMNCKLVSYNGAGTLWLLGNRADGPCGRSLVEGTAPQGTIVSAGNLISSPQAFYVTAGRIITAEDQFNNSIWTGGDQTQPQVRWIPNGAPTPTLSSYINVPVVQADVLPPSLTRPTMTAAAPGMVDVKAPPYNAKGDGTSDDTAAIQAALNAGCDGLTPKALYFPAGTYRITSTLYLNDHMGTACRNAFPFGGWIAGAGSSQTVIVMDSSLKKGVFATDGLSWATIQGITFRTWSYHSGDPTTSNFDIEFLPGYIASQLDTFYDVVFDGGFAAFATGVAPPTGGNCSSIVIFGGKMMNAHIGLVAGHFNALADGVYDSSFVANDYALGSWTQNSATLPPGGTFFAYNSTSTGTRIQDFLFAGAANGSTWYFYDWVSDAPLFFVSHPTSAAWPLMFDHAQLNARSGQPYLFDVASAQGPFFLYSTLSRSSIRLGQGGLGQSYAIKMASQTPDWLGTVAPSPNGVADAIDWNSPTLTSPGAPSLVVGQ